MPAKILDGKMLAQNTREQLKKKITQSDVTPGLAVILIGRDQASLAYVALKERACKDVGIHFEKYHFFHSETQKKILKKIDELNQRKDIQAILVQLPLPKHLDEHTIIQAIDPHKDVDGFHPQNIAELLDGTGHHPTPVLIKAIITLLDDAKLESKGLAVIIANSDVFMKPLGAVLERNGWQVKWTKPSQQNAKEEIKKADLLVSAIGKPWWITTEMINEGATVIDVGMTRDRKTLKLKGDAHPDVVNVAAVVTPVPGGVGPLTVAMLLENTYLLSATAFGHETA